MLFLMSRLAVTAALSLKAFRDVFVSVGAAQRCAYAVDLGRLPADRDMRQLGIDPKDMAALLRA